jgi:hypothetical protein
MGLAISRRVDYGDRGVVGRNCRNDDRAEAFTQSNSKRTKAAPNSPTLSIDRII